MPISERARVSDSSRSLETVMLPGRLLRREVEEVIEYNL